MINLLDHSCWSFEHVTYLSFESFRAFRSCSLTFLCDCVSRRSGLRMYSGAHFQTDWKIKKIIISTVLIRVASQRIIEIIQY